MRKMVLFLLLFGFTASYGQPAPDFKITSSKGAEINLYADYLDQGKTVVLELFWEGCPPCNSFAPLLGDLYKDWGDGNGDVEFIALDVLNNETDADVIAFQDRHGHTWPGASAEGGSLEALDPYTSGTYGTYLGTPTIVIIGPDKTVAYNVNGFMRNDNGIAVLDEAITATGAKKIEQVATTTLVGSVQNISQIGIGNVALKFSGASDVITITEADGLFSVPDLPIEQAYTVTPEKNTAIDNGVTTFDLVLIGKHILGLELFIDETQVIAADANLSGSVTTFDIVLIRRAILGFGNGLAAGSWRFIPETIELASLNDLNELSFVGVKIGDVNNTADPSLFQYNESRSSATPISLFVENQFVQAGEIIEIPFSVKEEMNLLGFQFTVDFDPESLQLLGVSETAIPNFGDTNINTQHQEKGQIAMSWYDLSNVSVTDLFSLTFKATQSGSLKDLLRISSAITPAEAYTTSEDIVAIDLQFTANELTNPTIAIIPNPIKEGITNIYLDITQQSDLEIELIGMDGRILQTFSYAVAEQGAQIIPLETSNLEEGMYVVNVMADGSLLRRAKFIKN